MFRILVLLGLAFALALCSGCAGYVTTRSTTVALRPPAPIVEVATVAPSPGYVWVDGYWSWNGYDYEWVHGYWDRPPVVGHVWHPGGWVVQGSGYVYVGGRWAAPGYRSTVRYVHARPRNRVVVRPAPRPRVAVRTSPRPRSTDVVRASPAPRPAVRPSSTRARVSPAPRTGVEVRGAAPRSGGRARARRSSDTRASVRVR